MGNARIARLLIEELSNRIRESEKHIAHPDKSVSDYHKKQIEDNRHRIWLHHQTIEREEKRRKMLVSLGVILSITFLIGAFFYFGQGWVNLFGVKENVKSYSESLDLVFNESGSYEWQLRENGTLDFVKLSGLIAGDGDVKIYLDNLLIVDSSKLTKTTAPITGFAAEGETSTEVSIPVEPSQPSEPTQPTESMQPETTQPAEQPSEPSSSETTQEGESQNASISQETNPPASENITENATSSEVSGPAENVTGPVQEITLREINSICEETCNLEGLNLTKSSYVIRVEASNARVKLTNLEYGLVPGLISENLTLNETITNVTLEQNITANGTNVSITTSKIGRIVIGKPVKWKTVVELDAPANVTIELPSGAENVTVTKIDEQANSEEARALITGLAVSGETQGKGLLSRVWNSIRSVFGAGITGNVISEEENVSSEDAPVEVILNDNATQYEINYETPAPEAFEETTSSGKIVTISAADELNYTDVLAYTELSRESPAGVVRLYHIVNGTRESVEFTEQDMNGNGLIDYIEWNVPHLSNQTYEIIEISGAQHLDANRTFISDIYDYVKTKDNNWSETINDSEYVRVRFRAQVDNTKEITIYARSVANGSSSIEVYLNDSDEKIAEISGINQEGTYKTTLENLNGSSDVFDFKVIGAVQFDHIIDPIETGTIAIKNVYSGEISMPAVNSYIVTLGAPIDTTSSVLFFSTRHDNSPTNGNVVGRIANSTTIEFFRPTAAAPSLNISWYVAEFSGGVVVYRGVNNVGGGAEINSSIEASVNTTSSFLVPGGYNNTGATWGDDDFVRMRLVNDTTVGLITSAGTTAGADISAWQVVQMNGAIVQRDLFTMAIGTNQTNVTLPAAIALSRSFLMSSYKTSTNIAASGALRGEILNSTVISFTRATSGPGVTLDVAWEVVQLPINNSVQRGVQTFGPTEMQQNVSITAVNLSRAVAFSSSSPNAGSPVGSQNSSVANHPGYSMFTHNFTSSTNLQLTRMINTGNGTAQLAWQVVEFSPSIINAPLWSNNKTNASSSTKKGESVYFNITLTDDSAGGYYIFSFYNGTAWINDSVTAWGTPSEIQITKTINATRGQVVQWFWWFNDSAGNYNQTSIWNITLANTLPTQTNPVLNSTFGTNTTAENLTCYNQSTADLDGDSVKNLYTWFKNGAQIGVLNMPFEGGSNGTWTKDYTVFGNNGTVSGAVWNGTGGYDGKGAYEFDGIDDYIDLGDKFEDTNRSGSIVFWIKLKQTIAPGWPGNQRPFGKYGDWEARWGGGSGSNLSVDLFTSVAAQTLTSTTTTWNAEQWYYIAITWNTTYQGLWVNGILEDSNAVGYSLVDSATPFYIGRSVSAGTSVNGTIDEFRIFNRTLSSQQVGALYNNRTDLIVSNELIVGENWTCSVTPNDGYGDGSTLRSNNVTIITLADTIFPTINFTNPTSSGLFVNRNYIEINVTANDTYLKNITIRVYNSTKSLVNSSNSTASPLYTNFTGLIGHLHFFNATACDNSGNCNSTETRNITLNVLPTQGMPILNSTFGTNYTTENLTCYNQSTADLDGDSVKNIFSWYKNSVSLGVLNMPFAGGSNSTWTKDYSGYATNGTVSGAVWNSSGGYDGRGAYEFDGTSKYINLGNPSNLNFVGTANMTVSAWVNVRGGQGLHRPIVCKGDTQYCLKPAIGNTFEFCVYDTTWKCVYSDSAFALNTWYYVTGRTSGTEVSLWVNGVKQAQTVNHTGITDNAHSVYIGSDGDGSRFFNGTIDDVSLYNKDLSAQEISALYNNRTDIIVSQELVGGDNWTCSITPNDGYGDGSTLRSNNVTIIALVDTIFPTINFTTPTSSGLTVNRNYIEINVTANDTYLKNITIRVYNSTKSLVNSSNSTASPLYTNFSGFLGHLHFFNATACDTSNNCNSTETRNITLNILPTQTNPILNSTLGTNTTNENLTCYNQSTADGNGDSVKNIVNWYRNGQSVMVLNTYFAGGSNSTWAKDYALGNNVTVVNATWNATGGYDGRGAYELSGNQSYLSIPDNAGITSVAKNFTVAVWAKANAWMSPDHNPIIWKGTQIGWGANYMFRIAANGGGSMTWGVTCGTTEGWFGGGTMSLGQWTQFVLTFDGTTASAYVNGTLVGSSTSCAGQALNVASGQPIRLGFGYRSSPTEETNFNGTIDDTRIWNRTLSAVEIATMYGDSRNILVSQELVGGDNWTCSITPNDGYGDGSTLLSNNVTIRDITPPSTITSLLNQSVGRTFIYWNWTNPADSDFNASIIYINGVNVANTSSNFYNATGLWPATSYTITINTQDNTGNINTTNVTNVTSTLANNLPTQTTPILNSTFGTNMTLENLTCYAQNTADADGDSVKNLYNWYKNNTPVMVLNLPFEGGSNSTWTKDYSRFGNNASAMGKQWVSNAGHDGKGAYYFNDSDVGLEVLPSASLNLTNFTVSVWVWFNSTITQWRRIVVKNNAWGETDGFQINLNDENNNLEIGGSGTTAFAPPCVNDWTTTDKNRWVHIAVTFNGSNATAYCDGVYKGSGTIEPVVPNNKNITIGNVHTMVDRDWVGYIDDVQIYNSILSSQQILALNNSRTDLIVSNELMLNDNWTCSVTPNDGYGDGSTLLSNNVTIRSADSIAPNVTLIAPTNNSYDGDGYIMFNFSAADNSALKNASLYINEVLNQTLSISGVSNQSMFNVTVGNGTYTWKIRVYDFAGNYNESETRTVIFNSSYLPIMNSTVFNGNTTNWSALPDLSNVCNGTAILEVVGIDKVQWLGCVNVLSQNFDAYVNLSYNNVTVNLGLNLTFNSSATITIRNLTWDAAPLIYADDVLCVEPQCSNVSYDIANGIAVFNVTHFTSYVTAGNSQMTIWDETDPNMPYANMTKYTNQSVKFFANYTARATNTTITNATCRVNFTDSQNNLMAYNATTNIYEYSRNFTTNGTFPWSVTCNATGNNTLTTNDTVNILYLDTISPNVSALAPAINSVFNVSDYIEIAANVTDNIGVSFVFANITYPNSTTMQLTLLNVSGSRYNATFRIPIDLAGVYNITIIANDTSGNINSSEKTNLTANLLPKINFVQRGSIADIGNITDAIGPVNNSKTFMLFTAGTDDSTPDDNQFTPNITTNRTISFTRYDGTGANSTIKWQTIERDYLTVQWGEQALASGINRLNVTLNAIDPAQTFVIVNGRCTDETAGDYQAGLFAGNFTNSTNLLLQRGNAGKCAATVSWQVVQVNGSTVQSGVSYILDNTANVSATINSINLSNTFLIFSTASIGTDTGADSNLIQGKFANETALFFAHNPATTLLNNTNRTIEWYAVTIPGAVVQNGSRALTGITPVQVSINPVNTTRAFHLTSYWSTLGTATYLNVLFTLELTNSTNLLFQKVAAAQTSNIAWFVVELPETIAAADTIYPIFSNYYDNNASLIGSGIGLFNVTLANTNGTVWLQINNTNITATNLTANVYNVSYNFTQNGTYTYTWYAYGNGTAKNLNNSGARYYTVNYSDITPPATITNLRNITVGRTFIYWNWTNPTDSDFNSSIIYIDGVNIANTSSNFYNATGLWPATSYTIRINTKDNSGNVNYTNVTNITTTLANNLPTQTNPILNSTLGTNTTNENLTCYNQSTADADGDSVRNVYNWFRNSQSIMVLNLPFAGPSNATWTKDYTVYSNNGTVVNATWNATGGYDGRGAYEFNGVDTSIVVNNSDSLNISGNQITMTAWIKVKGHVAGSYERIVVRPHTSQADPWNIYGMIVDAGGRPEFELGNSSLGHMGIVSVTPFPLNQWTFFAGVYNGTTAMIYLNGTFDSSVPFTGNLSQNNMSVYLGRNPHVTTEFFNGTLDEVKIYNRALSAAEISAIYNNGTNLIVSQELVGGDNWTCSVTPNDGYGDGSTLMSNNVTIRDITPPATITNLRNITVGRTFIYWNWTNPTDSDFNSSIIYINGVNVANTSSNFYNATGLWPATSYTIRINTKDNVGNVNYTNVTNTTSTLPNSLPTQTNPILNSTLGTNTTNENLTCYAQSTSDADGDSVRNVYLWYKNNLSLMVLNMPFAAPSNSTWTKDYALGNNGTVINAIWNATGGYDRRGAYEFNGNSNYINGTSSIGFFANSFTTTAWFKTNISHDGKIFSTTSAYHQMQVITAKFRVCINGCTLGTANVSDGNWHFAAVIGNSSGIYVYIDGSSTPDITQGASAANMAGIPRIGAQGAGTGGTGPAYYFNGSIDEVAVYNRSLSLQEIGAIYLNQSNVIVSQELVGGDNWTCSVTPNDGYGDGSTLMSNNVTISSLANNPPQITSVTNISAVTLNEGPNSTLVVVNFTAYDLDGATNLNDSSAMVNFSRSGEALRANTTCAKINSGGNYANYTCNVYMAWFDGAGTWNATASISDLSNFAAFNTTTNFTVNALTGFVHAPSPLTWASVSPGAINQTSNNDPLILNNTGNQDIAVGNVQVNATDLRGETTSSLALYANNFSIGIATGGAPPTECGATTVSKSVFVGIGSAVLPRGNFTINDGNTGQEQLYFCLKYVGAEVTSQTYSTANQGSWTIKILVVGLAIAGGRRRKKKDGEKNELIGELDLLREELREKYSSKNADSIDAIIKDLRPLLSMLLISLKENIPATIFSKDVGALEALCRYMKENLGMNYHEIAVALSRDDRTVWTACNKAIKKQKEAPKIKKTSIMLPITIFQDRKLTVLEAAIIHLKAKGMRFSEIGELLHRDQRNIWTIYSRATKK